MSCKLDQTDQIKYKFEYGKSGNSSLILNLQCILASAGLMLALCASAGQITTCEESRLLLRLEVDRRGVVPSLSFRRFRSTSKVSSALVLSC